MIITIKMIKNNISKTICVSYMIIGSKIKNK